MRTKKNLPKLKTAEEEREFWAKHSPLDFLNQANAQEVVFPNLKPSLTAISIRLPDEMIRTLKIMANKQDVPYQSLAKIFLAKQIRLEQKLLHKKRKNTRSRKAA